MRNVTTKTVMIGCLLFAAALMYLLTGTSNPETKSGPASDDVPPEWARASEDQLSEEHDGLSDAGSSDDGPVAGDSASPQRIENAGDRSADKGPEVSGSLVDVQDPDLPIEAHLERAAARHSWSDAELRGNRSVWEWGCEVAEEHLSRSDATVSELLRGDARSAYKRRLEIICDDLLMNLNLDKANSSLDGASWGDEESGRAVDEVRSLATSGFREAALERLGSELAAALDREDEFTVSRLVLTAALQSLMEPLVDPGKGNYDLLYGNVHPEVTAALMCRRGGGCTGAWHPFILRQCVRRGMGRGAFCLRPQTFDEAVYQTLTPLEFEAYQRFLAQLKSIMP